MRITIEKRTVLDQIEVTRSGIVQARFALLTINGGAERVDGYHRTSIEPGAVVEQRCAVISEQLSRMNEAPISAADIAKIAAHVALARSQQASSNTLDDYEEGTWTPVLTTADGQ